MSDYKQFLEMINSDDYLYLQKYYTTETMFDIAGIARNENHHSDFLRWLFSSEKRHGLGDFAVRKLIETAIFAADRLKNGKEFFADSQNIFNDANSALLKRLQYGNYKINSCTVKREWQDWNVYNTTDNDTTNKKKIKARVDLMLELHIDEVKQQADTIWIMIENKIYHSEGKSQTTKYYNGLKKHLEKNKNEGKILPVYLFAEENAKYKQWLDSGKDTKKPSYCSSLQFMPINYQFLMDGVLEPCRRKVDDKYSRMVLDDYARCLGCYRVVEPETDKPADAAQKPLHETVLAVSRNEKAPVEAIINHHREALHTVLDSALDTDDGTPDQVCVHLQKNQALYNALSYAAAMVLSDRIDEATEEELTLLEKLKNMNAKVNKRDEFTFKGKNYVSGDRKGYSLGYLARDLIEGYYRKNVHDIGRLICKLRKEYRTWESPSRWLGMVLTTRAEFEKFNEMLVDENKKWKDLRGSESNPKKNDCVRYPNGEPGKIFLEVYHMDARSYFIDKPDGKKYHSWDDRTKKESDDNPIYAISKEEPSGDDLFVARWWGANDIEKLLGILGDFYQYDPATRSITFK